MCVWTCALALFWTRASQASAPLSGVLENARIEQHVGDCVPMNLAFTDDEGRSVRLGRYFGQRPAILALVYHSCPNLCPMLLRHLTEGLNGIGMVAGRDFDVVVVSIDPADTPESAARLKRSYVRAYRHQDASDGWHFLTGAHAQIEQLAEAVGFHCVYDARQKQYAHALGAMVLSPEGALSHYFFGVDFSPADLEAALRDAAAGRSSQVDHPEQQYCLDYSPAASRYGRLAVHCLQGLAAAWVLLLLAYISRELARDWRSRIGVRTDPGLAKGETRGTDQGVQP